MGILARFLPPIVPAAWVTFLIAYPPQTPEWQAHLGASLAFLTIWLAVSLWVACTRRHRTLAENLRRASLPGIVAVFGALAALAIGIRLSYASPCWLPLMLLVLHISLAGNRPPIRFAALSMGLVASLIVMEGFILVLRQTPHAKWPWSLTSLAARLYQQDWRLIQYDRECARYDEELFYTLLPGTCVLENTEFTNTYHVNSLGVRDDEESLRGPEVIVAGDSHTMGLGVEQHELYTSHMERLTGRKVLNLSVSSYAPPRELTLLERVDRGSLTHLLIQLCANDDAEIRDYIEHEEVPRHPASLYESFVLELEQARRYYPGRYTTWIVSDAVRGQFEEMRLLPPRPRPSPRPAPREEMGYLLDVLESHPVDLSGVDIILYEINERSGPREWLVPMLSGLIAERAGRRHMNRLRVVSVYEVFDEEDFYHVDGHMRPSGHEKVALRLAAYIH